MGSKGLRAMKEYKVTIIVKELGFRSEPIKVSARNETHARSAAMARATNLPRLSGQMVEYEIRT